MANKVEFGLEQVHIAILDEATGTYDAPVAIPGAVTLSLDPEGEQSTFYADNTAYYTVATNTGYKAELEMALIPDTVLADILGWEIDTNGMLVEVADAQPSPFALLFEVTGNAAKKRYVFYKCTASRPKREHKTKAENTEPTTTTLDLTISPINIDGRLVVKAAIERTTQNATVFDNFFSSVLEPSFS